jgi:membrane-associated phospholipid phosphatase
MVVWTLYPRWRLACVFAVVLVAAALILAERHFVSDIIAGCLVGAVSGRLMTRSWQATEDVAQARSVN